MTHPNFVISPTQLERFAETAIGEVFGQLTDEQKVRNINAEELQVLIKYPAEIPKSAIESSTSILLEGLIDEFQTKRGGQTIQGFETTEYGFQIKGHDAKEFFGFLCDKGRQLEGANLQR